MCTSDLRLQNHVLWLVCLVLLRASAVGILIMCPKLDAVMSFRAATVELYLLSVLTVEHTPLVDTEALGGERGLGGRRVAEQGYLPRSLYMRIQDTKVLNISVYDIYQNGLHSRLIHKWFVVT